MSSREDHKTTPLEQFKYTALALKMIERGARVPVIAALLPLHKKLISQLHVEITGISSKKGPLPSDHIWYASTIVPWRVIQSSIIVSIYKSLKAESPKAMEAEILIATYDLYLAHVNSVGDEPHMNFDRVWHLMQQYRIKNLISANCSKCHSEFVVINGSLNHEYVCPLCKRTNSLRPDKFTSKLPRKVTEPQAAVVS